MLDVSLCRSGLLYVFIIVAGILLSSFLPSPLSNPTDKKGMLLHINTNITFFHHNNLSPFAFSIDQED